MIFTIFKKELKDTLRDRRTLMAMLVIPILIFPVIITVFASISEHFKEGVMEKTLKIGYYQANDQNTVIKMLESLPDSLGKMTFVPISSEKELKSQIQLDSLQAGFVFAKKFDQELSGESTANITVFINATKVGYKERIEASLAILDQKFIAERLIKLKITNEQIKPINVSYKNTASNQETIGKLAGGILPYFFIAFGFIGCMYPAIDLFTGEKERGTIETLLTTPVERWKILFGKMGVIVLSGLAAASFALIGLFISIEVMDLVKDPELLAVIHSLLTFKFLALLYLLLIPLTVFFAGIMIPIAVYAKTFKEAQSIITPLNIVVVLPAMVGFFPGIELTAITACIPVVNIVLATKELIAGTLDIGLLALSFFVMLSLAALAVIISFKQFDKESNVVI